MTTKPTSEEDLLTKEEVWSTADRLTFRQRIVFFGLLMAWPIILVSLDISPTKGLLGLPRFGDQFYEHALPRLKALDPPHKNGVGYDGQFYAQMAIDPLLKDPQFKVAVDDLGYRAQRIGLPAMAYLLGLGNPKSAVHIYCFLNLAFWFGLLWVVTQFFGTHSLERRLGIVTCVWTAGVLISITRALSDLPALCVGLMSVWLAMHGTKTWHRLSSILLAGGSGLLKETGVLSFIGCTEFPGLKKLVFKKWIGWGLTIAAMLLPVLLWQVYVRTQIGGGRSGMWNFNLPLMGLKDKLVATFSKSVNEFPKVPILEVLGPISIIAQCAYMLKKIRWSDPIWRFGLGFALLALVIAFPVWESQSAYSRVLLPLCVAFNFILVQDRSQITFGRYALWFWLGNIGLLDRAAPALLFWYGFEMWLKQKRPSDVNALN